MEKLALVFLPGAPPGSQVMRVLLSVNPILIAADSGLHTMVALGLEPHMVVGDMDSVDGSLLASIDPQRLKIFPPAKDWTDTELAIATARDLGASKVFLIGGSGGRLDHILGLTSLFIPQVGEPSSMVPDAWYGPDEEIFALSGEARLEVGLGETLSFIPLGDPGLVESEGLVWSLASVSWKTGRCSISNVAQCTTITIKTSGGPGGLLCIRNLGPDSPINLLLGF